MRPRPGALALAACLVLGAGAQAHAATLVDLGPTFVPDGLNNHQQVVGDIIDPNEDPDNPTPGQAALWDNGTLSALPVPAGAGQSDAKAINESGRIAGDFQLEASGVHPVYWDLLSGPHQIGPFAASGNDFNTASGADAAGEVVGTTIDTDGHAVGFLTTPAGVLGSRVGTADKADGNAEADAITPNGGAILGQVTGTTANSGAANGWYLWPSPGGAGTKIDLTPIGSGAPLFDHDRTVNVQNDLASDGTVLGFKGTGANRTYFLRLPNGTDSPLGSALIGHNGVNAKHVVIGTILAVDPPSGVMIPHAVIEKPDGTVVDLNSLLPAGTDYVLEDPLAIDDDGDIAGVGAQRSTHSQIGFLLRAGYVVDSTGDEPDKDTTDGACLTTANTCTLRAAIQQVDADGAATPTGISFAIAGSPLPQISPATPLPAITAPVDIDATSQSGAITAGSRTLGVIIDGTGAGASANGLDLGSGAAGSTIAGLQIQHFGADGVKLGAAHSQLADSLLTEDHDGAEVAASNVTVGTGNGLAGNIFFLDGDAPGLANYLTALHGQATSEATFRSSVSAFGAGILLSQPSATTTIDGNEIGVHGPGFGSAPDQLGADGPISTNLAGQPTFMPFGILAAPSAGTVSGVTIGASGADANVISGTIFGVAALAGGGGGVSGLSLRSNLLGTERTGAALDPFGGVAGVFATGAVSGLSIGAPGGGNRFQGEVFGTLLAGTAVASPVVQANTYGAEGTVRTTNALHDSFGLVLADVQGAQIGGTGAGQGNQIVGDGVGVALAGTQLADDTIAGNTIGSANPATFTTFANADLSAFDGGFGVLMSGNAKSGTSAPAQNVVFNANAIKGNVLAALAVSTTGVTWTANTFADNAFGLFDDGSAASQIGTAGHGNAFEDNGIGLLVTNTDPDAGTLTAAQVNPSDDSAATKTALLTPANTDVGFSAADALTTAALDGSSAQTSATPGSGTSILGNAVGVDAGGAAHPNELAVLLGGDEHGLRFGGTGGGEGNTVTGNRAAGVLITGSGAHEPSVQLLGNTIDNNENFTSTTLVGIPGLGIDLAGTQNGFGFGVNDQDATQPDQGPNGLQNAPVLTGAQTADGQITVSGALHGVANTAYLLEIFADDRPNPFGAGEGQTLLGRATVTTDGAGNAAVASTFGAPPATARFVSATATTVPAGGAPGVTSEFAIDTPIIAALVPPPATTPTTTPGPAPKTPPPSGVKTSGSSVTTSSATITLPAVVTCSSAAASSCHVTTSATVAATSARAVATAAKHKTKKARKPVPVGSSVTTLKPGASAKLHLKLSGHGLALLKKRHELSTTVTVTITGTGRKKVTKTLHVKVKYKRPRR